MSGTLVLLLILGVLVVLGVIESMDHRRRLAQIPIRVHVNGTRGKSSVTRLIAAGLRNGGVRTCAKTTGTLARMILPDGQEYPIFRPAGANVIEQLRIVRTAAQYKAEVLVIECMAVQPPLQALCETRLVRGTHGVLTNARADHLDVMGPSEIDVALALVATTPIGGTMFTAEQRHIDIVKDAVQDRGAKLEHVTRDEFDLVTPEDLEPFSYLEHAENVALALRVCSALGVERQVALEGMWKADPDPGCLTAVEIEFFGRRLVFVNGFAANDPESTERIFHMAQKQFPEQKRQVALINCRADRPDRSRQLGEAVVTWGHVDSYVLIGSGTYIFARAAISRGLDPGKIAYAEDRRVEEIFELLVEQSGRSSLIIGMANIGGMGLEIVRFFKNRSTLDGVKKVAS